MWLGFKAVHSMYGRHYVKDILCSTDSWRGWGSEEFTLPHLLQDMGELVHVNRGGVVFSYSSKNWWESNLGSRWQEICNDPSSVRCGIVVLQSVAPGPIACRARWMSGHTISSLQLRSVREPWRRVAFYHWGGYMLTHIITDLLSQQSTSRTAYPMKRSQNPRQTHLLPLLKATVKQKTRLWRGSWTTIAWSRAHGMDTTLQGCSSQPESREFWLHAALFGPNKIHAT